MAGTVTLNSLFYGLGRIFPKLNQVKSSTYLTFWNFTALNIYYEEWAQAQIAAIVEYFKLGENDEEI